MGNRNGNYQNIWVLDFETTTNETEYYKRMLAETGKEWARPVYWYMKKLDEDRETGGEEFEGISWEDFAQTLSRPAFHKNTIIYVHNLGFDGEIVLYILQNVLRYKAAHLKYEDGILKREGYKIVKDKHGKDKVVLKPKHYEVFRNGRKIYKLTFRHTPKMSGLKYPVEIVFRCSANILSSSVNSLGMSYKKETFLGDKLQKMLNDEKARKDTFYIREPEKSLEDMYKVNPDYIKYCKRDVEIVRRSLNDFVETINEIKSVKDYCERENDGEPLNILAMGITIAGIGRELMRTIWVNDFQAGRTEYNQTNNYYHKKKDFEGDELGSMLKLGIHTHNTFSEVYEYDGKFAKFYSGGFTQFNPLYQKMEDINEAGDCIKCDFSSAYPYQMTKPLPFGKLLDEETFKREYLDKNGWWRDGVDYYCFVHYHIKKATPKDIMAHCPVLNNFTRAEGNSGKKFRYNPNPQYDFVYRGTQLEWNELQHWCDFELDEDYVPQRYYMLAAPFLRKCAEELYDIKDYFSDLGLSAKKQSIKIFVNSLYGSLALGMDFDNFEYVDYGSFVELEKELAKAREQRDECYVDYDDAKKAKATSAKIVGVSRSIDIIDHNNEKDTLVGIRTNVYTDKEKGFNIAAAAVITSLQRINLWSLIRKVGAEYFAYSDTDSVVWVNLTPEKRKEIEALTEIKPNGISNIGRLEVEKRYIVGFFSGKAKEYITKYLAYDEKNKTFLKYKRNNGIIELDKDGNKQFVPCCREEAEILTDIKAAGFALDERQGGYMEITPAARAKLSNEEIRMHFGEKYKEKYEKELPDEFCERIRHGEMYYVGGGVSFKLVNGAPLIINIDKWTSLGES